MESQPEEFKQLNKLWLRYTAALEPGDYGMSREEFKDMFWVQFEGTEGGKLSVPGYSYVSEKSSDGRTPEQIARGEAPVVTDPNTGQPEITSQTPYEQAVSAIGSADLSIETTVSESAIYTTEQLENARPALGNLSSVFGQEQLRDVVSQFNSTESREQLRELAVQLGQDTVHVVDRDSYKVPGETDADAGYGAMGIKPGEFFIYVDERGNPHWASPTKFYHRKAGDKPGWGTGNYNRSVFEFAYGPDGTVAWMNSDPY